jgi:hypothetical protein
MMSFPTDVNGVSLANIHWIVVTIFYIINHLTNSVGWIKRTLKIIPKKGFCFSMSICASKTLKSNGGATLESGYAYEPPDF